ncbi:MAG: hypothetical protein IPL33_02275 [Sphingobacteriales bacterium]|nr:hypothetical protein [Sphingobacteriales bacterium]
MRPIFTNSARFSVPTDDLYQLIKSLSRNEKGYFKNMPVALAAAMCYTSNCLK